MASIKRLLNPNDIDASIQRQQHWGREFKTEEPGDVPILQDQSWAGLFGELGITDSALDLENQASAVNALHATSFNYAQEAIEEWAAHDLPSSSQPQSAPRTPPPPSDDTTEYSNGVKEDICYGMVYRAPVKLAGEMAEVDAKLEQGSDCYAAGHYVLAISKSSDQIQLTFPDGTVLGILSAQLTKAFEDILGTRGVQFEALAHIASLRETIGRAAKASDAVVRANINIYGSSTASEEIGHHLSEHKVYLQRPDYQRPGCAYKNPHFLEIPDIEYSNNGPTNTTEPQGPASEAEKVEQFRSTITDVYKSLQRSKHLSRLESDARLKTKLLTHQRQALDFMAQRESGPIPEDFRLWQPVDIEGKTWYRHEVTLARSRIPPAETGGGILADEMGMGKSLSILSRVLKTLDEAHEWASKTSAPSTDGIVSMKKPSRATLIIASSALMIHEWLKELEHHLHREVFENIKTIKYHGQYREKDVSKLVDSDIVITTYHTLAADFSGQCNPLNEIEWYRIVLDEAHIIRRQSTGLNRTVSELHANYRWCLTGTPIQNCLDDIGALFAFIRVNPFDSISMFRRFISIPYDEGGQRRVIATRRLGQLLDSLCIRRTKDLLDLPENQDRRRFVQFTPEERQQYDQTKTIMIRAIRQRAGEFDRKSMFGMFQAQLQLRILCNHGTYQHPFSWARRSLLEEREDAECSLGRNGERKCSSCRQMLPIIGSEYRKYAEHCAHILCSECLVESDHDKDEAQGGPLHCPLCFPFLSSEPRERTQEQETPEYFRPEGHSSKMVALVTDIQENLWQTKSIIFSCWTRTLDLIAKYLRDANIPFERIDGESPLARRQKILDEFAESPALPVLIMTTGTGAFGLNLTSANRVFIVEPQWNPSVENQAIARALRLGQVESVLVTRYVIDETVEREMRSQQDRKLKIAEIGWD